jgi:hypothetical protein
MSDLHKRKELLSVWWKRNQNNLQKKKNPKLTYKKRRLWRNNLQKEKNLNPTYKKKRNLNWPKKKKKILNHPTKRKRLPNWSTKKKKKLNLLTKKNLLAYEIKKGINIIKKERVVSGNKRINQKNIFLKRGVTKLGKLKKFFF